MLGTKLEVCTISEKRKETVLECHKKQQKFCKNT